jgi:hypothetical protein
MKDIYLLMLSVMFAVACGGAGSGAPAAQAADDDVGTTAADAEGDDGAATTTSPDETADAESTAPAGEGEAAEGDADAAQTAAEGEAAGEAPADEEPPPSDDLQAYVGATTGYTPEYRTVMDNMGLFKQCYLDALRSTPDISGKLKIRFTVPKNGKVKKAKAVVNELNDEVADCVLRELKKMKFPKRAKNRTVEYPFEFTPAK